MDLPISQVFYLNELAVKRKGIIDYGKLESPQSPRKTYEKSKGGRFLVEFANNVSIHGFNHLVSPKRRIYERYFVGLIILGGLGCLIGISLDSWHRYQHESTMLVIDNNFRKFVIAKPAITICPINYIDERNFPRVFEKYNITDTFETRKFLLSLSRLRYDNIRETIDKHFDCINPNLWLRLLYELRGEVNVMSQYSNEFTWISTERGLCMMFAGNLDAYLSLEHWLSNDTNVRKILKVREKSFFDINNYALAGSISCRTHNYTISIHYPDTIIDYDTQEYLVKLVTFYTLTIGIVEVNSSKSINKISVQRRNCKFHHDRGLKMWPIYTNHLCKLECRYHLMIQLCGCLPHFAKPYNNVPICNASQLMCIAEYATEILSINYDELKVCRCLPDCNEALYIDKEFTSFDFVEGSASDGIVTLNIEFPQVKYIRVEIFSFTDFLASIGGAAGLFLGLSVLSFIEILYFATLRLIFYWINETRQKKKIQSVLVKPGTKFNGWVT